MTTIVGGKLMQINKNALRNFLKHNDNHNRIKEEAETWRCYEQTKQITREERSKTIVEKLSRKTGTLHKDASPMSLKSGYWTQKLMEVAEKADNRWGHAGYKELYPEEFGGDNGNEESKEESSQIKVKQAEVIGVAQNKESDRTKSNWKRREYRVNQAYRASQQRRSRSPPRKYLATYKARTYSGNSPFLNRLSRKYSRSPPCRKYSKSPSTRKYSRSPVAKNYSKSPSPKRHSRKRYSRSLSPRKRSKSPKTRKRSKSISPRKSPRTSQSRKYSRSPQSRKRSKSPQSRKRSKSPQSRKHSKSPQSRKRSKSPQSRKRSKSPQSRKRSKSPQSRKRSKSPQSRKRSKSPQSRKRSKSPQSRKRSKSPQSRKHSKSPLEDSTQPIVSTRNQYSQNKLRQDDTVEGSLSKTKIGKTIDSEDHQDIHKKYDSQHNHKKAKLKKVKSRKLLKDNVETSSAENNEVSQSESQKGKRSRKSDVHSNSKKKTNQKSKKKKLKAKKETRKDKAGKWDRMDREDSPSGDSISADEKFLKDSKDSKPDTNTYLKISNEEVICKGFNVLEILETTDNTKNVNSSLENLSQKEAQNQEVTGEESGFRAIATENNEYIEQGVDFSRVGTFDSQSEDKRESIALSPFSSINMSKLNGITTVEERSHPVFDNKTLSVSLSIKDVNGNSETLTDDRIDQDIPDKKLEDDEDEYRLSNFHAENISTNRCEFNMIPTDVEGEDNKIMLQCDDDIYSDIIQMVDERNTEFQANKTSRKKKRTRSSNEESYSGDDESIDDYKKSSTKSRRQKRSHYGDKYQSTGSYYSSNDGEKNSSQKHKASMKEGRNSAVKQNRSKRYKSKYENSESYSSDTSDVDSYERKYKQSEISKEKRQKSKSKKQKSKAKGQRSSSSDREKSCKHSRVKSVKEKLYDDKSSDDSSEKEERRLKKHKDKRRKGRDVDVKNNNSDIGSMSDRSTSRKRSNKNKRLDLDSDLDSDDSSSVRKVLKHKKVKKGHLYDHSGKSSSDTDYSTYTKGRSNHKSKIKDVSPLEQNHNKVMKVKKSELKDISDKMSKKSRRKQRQTPIESSHSSDKSDSSYFYEDAKKHNKSKKQKLSKHSDSNLTSDHDSYYSELDRQKAKVKRKRRRPKEDSTSSSSQEESKSGSKKIKCSKKRKKDNIRYESVQNTDSDITSEVDVKKKKVSVGTKGGKKSKAKKRK